MPGSTLDQRVELALKLRSQGYRAFKFHAAPRAGSVLLELFWRGLPTTPVEALVAFLKDTTNSPGARVVAFDLIHRADAKLAEDLTPTLLNDVSSDLRRHPVAKLIEAGDAAMDKKEKEKAIVLLMRLLPEQLPAEHNKLEWSYDGRPFLTPRGDLVEPALDVGELVEIDLVPLEARHPGKRGDVLEADLDRRAFDRAESVLADVLTKAHGSTNPVNLVKAALEALKSLRTKADVERLRGVTLS